MFALRQRTIDPEAERLAAAARARGIARAYGLGEAAAIGELAGQGKAVCPYNAPVHRSAWGQGWRDAMEAAR